MINLSKFKPGQIFISNDGTKFKFIEELLDPKALTSYPYKLQELYSKQYEFFTVNGEYITDRPDHRLSLFEPVKTPSKLKIKPKPLPKQSKEDLAILSIIL